MARAVNLSTPSPAVSGQIDNTGGQVRRMSSLETSGSNPATFYIYDGTGTGGQLLDVIALSAGQSTRDQYRIHEYPYRNGLYIDVVSGTLQLALTVWHSDDWDLEGEPVIIVGQLDINIGQ